MRFEQYRDRYSRIRMERDEHGVLELTLHTDGGPFDYTIGAGPSPHAELAEAFTDVAGDDENRVILLAGTGDRFTGPAATPDRFLSGDLRAWERIRREGVRLTMGLLEIDAPIISCVNGPALRHAEIGLLADIVLAADTATFQDTAHMSNGLVPGDGMNVVLPLLMGYNRGRYHLLTGKAFTAEEAHDWGLVAEVMPAEDLLPRGRELAHQLASKNPLLLRYTRLLFMHPLKQMMHDVLGYGLALESLAAVDETQRREAAAAGRRSHDAVTDAL
jgi:enoyl-CoA hydratase/carnithine racemase